MQSVTTIERQLLISKMQKAIATLSEITYTTKLQQELTTSLTKIWPLSTQEKRELLTQLYTFDAATALSAVYQSILQDSLTPFSTLTPTKVLSEVDYKWLIDQLSSPKENNIDTIAKRLEGVTELNFSGRLSSSIDCVQISKLCGALANNRSLITLNFSNCKFVSVHPITLLTNKLLIADNSSIQGLILSNCSLSWSDLSYFVKCFVAGDIKLKLLDLSNNPLLDEHSQLWVSLSSNRYLEVLDLYSEVEVMRNLGILRMILGENTILKSLRMGKVAADSTFSHQEIIDTMRGNFSLTSIEYQINFFDSGETVSSQGHPELQQFMARNTYLADPAKISAEDQELRLQPSNIYLVDPENISAKIGSKLAKFTPLPNVVNQIIISYCRFFATPPHDDSTSASGSTPSQVKVSSLGS